MIDSLRKRVLVTALLFLTAGAARAEPSPDGAIRAVEDQQAQAWNAHDARAYAALFTEDADIINVLGWHWKGRAEAEQKLRRAFAFVFAQSRLAIDDVNIRPLSDDIALAYVSWSMTGALSPDGSGSNIPQRGIQTQLLRRTDGRWLILSFQNTNAVPERPFPAQAVPRQAPPAQATAPAVPEPDRRGCWVATKEGKCLISKGK